MSLYHEYRGEGLRVAGIATAFEDFDKNTLENLKMLAETGEVIGETRKVLSMQGQLREGKRLSYKIPFPLGMDRLVKTDANMSQTRIMPFIYAQVPDFDSRAEDDRKEMVQRVTDYMLSKEYFAETFDTFALQGTPSTILVDGRGILRDVSFGRSVNLEAMIQGLIDEI